LVGLKVSDGRLEFEKEVSQKGLCLFDKKMPYSGSATIHLCFYKNHLLPGPYSAAPIRSGQLGKPAIE
jgi:hypothetical protein